MHELFLKVFYSWTNKKKYKKQILQYNICYTNKLAMQNTILIAKIVENTKKKELDIPNVEIT